MSDESNAVKNLGSLFPANAVDAQEWSRVEPLLTPQQLRRRYFFGIPLVSFMPDPITGKRDVLQDDDLTDHIMRGAAQSEIEIGIDIMPVQHDQKQPFDRNFWESYGFLQVPNRPVASVEKVAFTPATGQDLLVLDPSWIESANFIKGQINIIPIVPAASTNLVSATVGSGGAAFITIFYGKHWIPAFVRVTYTTGYPNRSIPRIINEVIGCNAAISILNQLSASIRYTSYSLGADSLNQSVAGPGPMQYQFLIEQYTTKKQELVRKIRNLYGLSVTSNFI